jgi:hypothetical protein
MNKQKLEQQAYFTLTESALSENPYLDYAKHSRKEVRYQTSSGRASPKE